MIETAHLLPARHDGLPFWKMSGSGNDFVVIDNRAGTLRADDAPAFARAVCRHRLSVGADGVVLIEDPAPGDDVDFAWRYINADGTDGEFCGNGAMCGARFAVLAGLAPAACRFRTPAGVVQARVAEDATDPRVAVRIADPGPVGSPRDIEVVHEGRQVGVRLRPVAVGVPHAVAVVSDLADPFGLDSGMATPSPAVGGSAEHAMVPPDDPVFVAVARMIRHHVRFAPAGTNVDVIQVLDRHTLRMRTYERGVEDETLACGSGAVASACVALAEGIVTSPVTVITRSGRPLEVACDWDPTAQRAANVTLTGEARVIAAGVIGVEALR
jgi:diaminopimelate epimerase